MHRFLVAPPLWFALLPLGLYLLVLGGLHLRRRPFVLSGVADAALLAASVAGLVLAGPLALLRPFSLGAPVSVVILLVTFLLLVAIWVLAARPRLVVYNITAERLRPLVAELAATLDPQARWAGDVVALPARGLQVHLDGHGSMRSVTLATVGARTSPEGWSEFSRRLRRSIRAARVRRSLWGPLFAGAGCGLVAVCLWLALFGPAPRPATPADAPAPSGVLHRDPSHRSGAA